MPLILIEVSITLFVGLVAVLTTGAIKYFALLAILFLLTIFILLVHFLKSKQVNKEKNEQIEKDRTDSRYSY